MSNIPIPQPGQPIDQSYIYQIVDTLNSVSTKVSSNFAESRYQSPYVTQSQRTSEMSFVGGYKVVQTWSQVAEDQIVNFTYDFGVTFAYPPIVTLTPVLISNTPAGKTVTAVIVSTSNTQVTGSIRFEAKGAAAVGVNIIAIGVGAVANTSSNKVATSISPSQ